MKLHFVLSGLALAGLALTASAAPAKSPAAQSSLSIGGGLGFGPRFMGSKRSHASLLPLLDYQHPSGFFASTQRGLGWAGGGDDFSYGLALAPRAERDDKDHGVLSASGGGKELAGMGEVREAALAVLGLGAQMNDLLRLSTAVELPLSNRQSGSAAHFSASLTLRQTRQDTVSLTGTVSYGDGKFLHTYFGVSAVQAANSGLAAYTPKSGIYKTSLSASWNYKFDEHWSATGLVGVSRLQGDAGSSPITRRRTAPDGGLILSYTY